MLVHIYIMSCTHTHHTHTHTHTYTHTHTHTQTVTLTYTQTYQKMLHTHMQRHNTGMHVYLVGAEKGHVFTEVGQTRHCVRITQIACAWENKH